jgi:hypothetical protein
VGASERR